MFSLFFFHCLHFLHFYLDKKSAHNIIQIFYQLLLNTYATADSSIILIDCIQK